jgi:hypothetical protein
VASRQLILRLRASSTPPRSSQSSHSSHFPHNVPSTTHAPKLFSFLHTCLDSSYFTPLLNFHDMKDIYGTSNHLAKRRNPKEKESPFIVPHACKVESTTSPLGSVRNTAGGMHACTYRRTQPRTTPDLFTQKVRCSCPNGRNSSICVSQGIGSLSGRWPTRLQSCTVSPGRLYLGRVANGVSVGSDVL